MFCSLFKGPVLFYRYHLGSGGKKSRVAILLKKLKQSEDQNRLEVGSKTRIKHCMPIIQLCQLLDRAQVGRYIIAWSNQEFITGNLLSILIFYTLLYTGFGPLVV
jgi:hypothetical protein